MKIRRRAEGYYLLALGLLLLAAPSFLKQPGIASHKLLVATDKLHDGVFNGTVIFVLEHNGFGARGLALNRPFKDGTMRAGGPVSPETIYTLHSLDVVTGDTVKIPELDMGYTEDTDVEAKEHLAFKGYASWAPGQLNLEIKRGVWKVVPADAKFIFYTKPDMVRKKAEKLPALN